MDKDELRFKLLESAFISIDGQMFRMSGCNPDEDLIFYGDENCVGDDRCSSLDELKSQDVKFFKIVEMV
jgi:hypothetical protein